MMIFNIAVLAFAAFAAAAPTRRAATITDTEILQVCISHSRHINPT